MKWKSGPARSGRIGDERVRTLFAWRPLEAEDGFTYWLSRLVVHEKLLPKVGRGGFEEESEKWEIQKAEPLSKLRKKGKRK